MRGEQPKHMKNQ